MSQNNLASRIFEAKDALSSGEDDLFVLLQAAGIKDYSRVDFDSYDSSFELYDAVPFDVEFSEKALISLASAGFDRFWMHDIDENGFNTERYVDLGGIRDAK